MNILRFLMLAFLMGTISGCMPMSDESVTLSFWTDKALDEVGFNMLYVNDSYIGDLNEGLENPVCGDSDLLNYTMKMSEDLHLSVRNIEGESVDIGVVNLFSVSTGIKIKPAEKAAIFVDQSLDDECTLVYMNWD